MLVSLFCASRLSDATRRMSATELVLRSSVAAAAPSQLAAALQPSIQMVVSSSRPSSRDASCAQHQFRRSSISSVAAAAAAAGDGSVPRR